MHVPKFDQVIDLLPGWADKKNQCNDLKLQQFLTDCHSCSGGGGPSRVIWIALQRVSGSAAVREVIGEWVFAVSFPQQKELSLIDERNHTPDWAKSGWNEQAGTTKAALQNK